MSSSPLWSYAVKNEVHVIYDFRSGSFGPPFFGGENGSSVNSTNHETQTQASAAAVLPPSSESLVPSISSTKTIHSNNQPSPPLTPTLKGAEFKVFFFFFFQVQIEREVGNHERRSDHGSQNREVQPQFAQVLLFSYRRVLQAKRTTKMSGSRFF